MKWWGLFLLTTFVLVFFGLSFKYCVLFTVFVVFSSWMTYIAQEKKVEFDFEILFKLLEWLGYGVPTRHIDSRATNEYISSKHRSVDNSTSSGELTAPLNAHRNEIIFNIIRDFVESWYNDVGEGEHFTQETRQNLYNISEELLRRLSDVDVHVLIENVIHLFRIHLGRFYEAKKQVGGVTINVRRKLESEYLGEKSKLKDASQVIFLHIALSNPAAELDYIRTVVDIILHLVAPQDFTDCETGRFVLKEILSVQGLLPLVDLMSDPDWVNQAIADVLSPDSLTKSDSMLNTRNPVNKIDKSSKKHGVNTTSSVDASSFAVERNDQNKLENEMEITGSLTSTKTLTSQSAVDFVDSGGEGILLDSVSLRSREEEINSKYVSALSSSPPGELTSSWAYCPSPDSNVFTDTEFSHMKRKILEDQGKLGSDFKPQSICCTTVESSGEGYGYEIPKLTKQTIETDKSPLVQMSVEHKNLQRTKSEEDILGNRIERMRSSSCPHKAIELGDTLHGTHSEITLGKSSQESCPVCIELTAMANPHVTSLVRCTEHFQNTHACDVSSPHYFHKEDDLTASLHNDGYDIINSCDMCHNNLFYSDTDSPKVTLTEPNVLDSSESSSNSVQDAQEMKENSSEEEDISVFVSAQVLLPPWEETKSKSDTDVLSKGVFTRRGCHSAENLYCCCVNNITSTSCPIHGEDSLTMESVMCDVVEEKAQETLLSKSNPLPRPSRLVKVHSRVDVHPLVTRQPLSSDTDSDLERKPRPRPPRPRLSSGKKKRQSSLNEDGTPKSSRNRTVCDEPGKSEKDSEVKSGSEGGFDVIDKWKKLFTEIAGSQKKIILDMTRLPEQPEKVSSQRKERLQKRKSADSETVGETSSLHPPRLQRKSFSMESGMNILEKIDGFLNKTSNENIAEPPIESTKTLQSEGEMSDETDGSLFKKSAARKSLTKSYSLNMGSHVKPQAVKLICISSTELAYEAGQPGGNKYTLYHIEYDIRIWPDIYNLEVGDAKLKLKPPPSTPSGLMTSPFPLGEEGSHNSQDEASEKSGTKEDVDSTQPGRAGGVVEDKIKRVNAVVPVRRLIKRRYREFLELHNRLTHGAHEAEMKGILKPNRKYNSLFGRLDREVVEGRRKLLEEYLEDLVAKPNLRNSKEIKEFLGVGSQVHVSFVKQSVADVVSQSIPRVDKMLTRQVNKVLDSIKTTFESGPTEESKDVESDGTSELTKKRKTDNGERAYLFDDRGVLDKNVEAFFENFAVKLLVGCVHDSSVDTSDDRRDVEDNELTDDKDTCQEACMYQCYESDSLSSDRDSDFRSESSRPEDSDEHSPSASSTPAKKKKLLQKKSKSGKDDGSKFVYKKKLSDSRHIQASDAATLSQSKLWRKGSSVQAMEETRSQHFLRGDAYPHINFKRRRGRRGMHFDWGEKQFSLSTEYTSQDEDMDSSDLVSHEESPCPLTDTILTLVCDVLRGKHSWASLERVHQAFTAVFGGLFEWWLRRKIDELVEPQAWDEYLTLLQEVIWPNGELKTDEEPVRTEEEKQQAKEEAIHQLMEFLPGIAKMLIGSQSYRNCAEDIIESLQCPRINRFLVYNILEIILQEIAPELSAQLLSPKSP